MSLCFNEKWLHPPSAPFLTLKKIISAMNPNLLSPLDFHIELELLDVLGCSSPKTDGES